MKARTLTTLALLLLATAANAQIINGDFNAGLGAWLPTQSGEVTTSAVASGGNPGGAVRFFGDGSFFLPPEGSGSITQNFVCGEEGSGSSCVIGFQYRHAFSSGVQVRLQAVVDGFPQFTTVLGGSGSPWTDVSFSVPCGPHQISLQVLNLQGGSNDDWEVYIDNVTAQCDGVVGTDATNWGTLKSNYR